MTQPVIDTTGVAMADAPASNAPLAPAPMQQSAAPRPPVEQLTIGDIQSRIRTVLFEEHDLTPAQISKIEQFSAIMVGDQRWAIGEKTPGNDAFIILAMYRGEANEQIADQMQGDTRVYTIPVSVVRPGEKAYRRITLNPVMQKQLTDRMTFERFVEAVAYEDYSIAVETHIVELEDDDEDDEESDDEPEVKS